MHKGTAAGLNTAGHIVLDTAGGVLANTPAASYLSSAGDWLSTAHDNIQNFLGDYELPTKQYGSAFQNFINNPGQTVHRTLGAAIPLAGTVLADKGLGKGISIGTGLLGRGATKFLPKLGKWGPGLLRQGQRLANAARNADRTLINKADRITKNYPMPMRTPLMFAAKHARGGLSTLGRLTPVLDMFTGFLHTDPRDSNTENAVKDIGRGTLPYLALLNSKNIVKSLLTKAPAIREGFASGASRGMLESAKHTTSDAGILGDYVLPGLQNTVNGAPDYIKDIYNGIATLSPGLLASGILSPDSLEQANNIRLGIKGDLIGEEQRNDILKNWINNMPYNRYLSVFGIQPSAQSAMKSITSTVYDNKPNMGAAIIRGIKGAINNDASLYSTMYGPRFKQDGKAVIDAAHTFAKNYAGQPRNTGRAIRGADAVLMDETTPETRDKLIDFKKKFPEALRAEAEKLAEKYPNSSIYKYLAKGMAIYNALPDFLKHKIYPPNRPTPIKELKEPLPETTK